MPPRQVAGATGLLTPDAVAAGFRLDANGTGILAGP
jgi:hypothetical protein